MIYSDSGVKARDVSSTVTRDVNPAAERLMQRLLDYGEKLICLLLFSALVLRLSHSLTIKPLNALAFISDGLIVYLILTRRFSIATTRPLDWSLALLGTALPLMVRAGGHSLGPQAAGGALMVIGILFSVWAKLTLRRSFGLAAANRGVVVRGPYRLVRHPMYVGYILADLGFLLNNPLAWNALIVWGALLSQVGRVLAEERFLKADPHYQAFVRRTPFRLAPGLF